MALRNTSERYEYIYGSNVRKLETDTAGSRWQTARTGKGSFCKEECEKTRTKKNGE